MVIGIAKIPAADPEQTEHILRIALDGLRYRPDTRRGLIPRSGSPPAELAGREGGSRSAESG